jgi:hypothetical protein
MKQPGRITAMKPRRIIGVLAAVLALGACKDDGTGPDANTAGSFEATMSGGFSASLSGTARSGTVQGYYLISMEDTDVQGLPGGIALLRPGGRPAAGSYTVTDDLFSQTSFLAGAGTGDVASQNGLNFDATSGTVTITESTASNVRGTFQLSGVGSRALTPTTTFPITVTGSFNSADQDP